MTERKEEIEGDKEKEEEEQLVVIVVTWSWPMLDCQRERKLRGCLWSAKL